MVMDYSCTIVGGLVDKPKSPHDGWLRLVFNGQYPHNLMVHISQIASLSQYILLIPMMDGCVEIISPFLWLNLLKSLFNILSWFVSTHIYIYNIIILR
jgi:hypothetical protein